jgi:Ser/Thr protein kinase RdoA (MazF antagonist)
MAYKYLPQLESEYGLKQPLIFDHIHNGPDNDVFIITDPQSNKFALRQNKRAGKKIDFEIEILSRLAEAGFSSPRIIQTKSKADFVAVDDTQLVLFAHIQGFQIQNLAIENLETGIFSRGAEKLGKLHTLTNKMQLASLPARNIFTEFDRFLKLDEKTLKRFKNSEILLKQIKDFYSKAQSKIDSGKELYGVIHNDYRVQNLIYTENDCFVIDFDWACYGPLLKDLGLAMAEWSLFDFKTGPSKTAMEKFIKGYNKTAPQAVLYDENLIFWICFACLSDACTFFADVNEGQYSDKTIDDIDQCHMYKKFKYFRNQLPK